MPASSSVTPIVNISFASLPRRLPLPRPHEERNFTKRFLLPIPGHTGMATWNHIPWEWLLLLYKVEFSILLNKMGICASRSGSTNGRHLDRAYQRFERSRRKEGPVAQPLRS